MTVPSFHFSSLVEKLFHTRLISKSCHELYPNLAVCHYYCCSCVHSGHHDLSCVLDGKTWPQNWHLLPSGGGSVYPPRESGLALHLLWSIVCAGSDVWDLEPRPQDSEHLHHRSLEHSGCHGGESSQTMWGERPSQDDLSARPLYEKRPSDFPEMPVDCS